MKINLNNKNVILLVFDVKNAFLKTKALKFQGFIIIYSCFAFQTKTYPNLH